MSNTKHTPGPWMVKPGKVSWNIHSHKPQQAVLNSTLTGQFDVTAVAFGRTEEETESNAKLIAAAPELLAALQAMDDLDELEHLSDKWFQQAAKADKLRKEAIKKATE